MILKRCSMHSFEKLTKDRTIICYGIGNEFNQIIENYREYNWVKRIKYLVDGNNDCFGKKIKIENKDYTIISLNELKKEELSSAIIIPTCASFYEVVDYLNGFEWLDNVECFIFHCMFNLGDGIIQKIRQTEDLLIPSTIHYCWFGGKPLPDIYKEYIDSWYKFCPKYNIVEWNETNCDIEEIAFTSEAYKVGKYGFVPDYFRLKIIYENGGIYLDTDVELIKNLDDLRYNKAFCGTEFPGRAAFGLGFGATKHNLVIKKLMDYYLKAHFLNEEGKVIEIPSPIIQSRILTEMGLKNGTGLRIVQGMTVYPVDVLSPKNPYTGEIIITENTYSIHHFDGTWLSNENKNIRQIKLEKAQKILNMLETG